MEHPFVDYTKLTDEQLVEQTNKLHLNMYHAEEYGHSQMVAEIRIMLEAIELERTQRFFNLEQEVIKKELKVNKKIKDPMATITLGHIKGVDDIDE